MVNEVGQQLLCHYSVADLRFRRNTKRYTDVNPSAEVLRKLRIDNGPKFMHLEYFWIRRRILDVTGGTERKKCGDSLEDHLRRHVT